MAVRLEWLHHHYKVKVYDASILTKPANVECGTHTWGHLTDTSFFHRRWDETSFQHKGLFCFDWLNVQIWLSLQDVIRTRSKTGISQNALLHSFSDPIQISAGFHLSSLQIKEHHGGLGSPNKTGYRWGGETLCTSRISHQSEKVRIKVLCFHHKDVCWLFQSKTEAWERANGGQTSQVESVLYFIDLEWLPQRNRGR